MTGTETNQQDLQQQTVWNKWQAWSIEHQNLSYFLAILAVLLFLFVALIIFWALFPTSAPAWTGFAETDHPLYTGRSPAKTLWDWLGLLIIPLVLAIGAALIGRAQDQNGAASRLDR